MIPAHHRTGPGNAPHTAWFLHGILGSGSNWRGFARRFVERNPGWSAVLVDQRNHGDSVGAPSPHTLSACADDLWELAGELGGPPQLLVGHSFGGKVALTFAGQAGRLGATGPGALERVWVLDAFPGPWPGRPEDDAEVVAVIGALSRIPQPLAAREDVVSHLTAAGFSMGLARWMTTNLRHDGQGYRWRFDLVAVREMIADYFVADLWPVLDEPGPGLHIDVVRAEHSLRWSEQERARFAALPPDGPVRLHLLPDSGHWVHVDNPDGLMEMIEVGSGLR